MIFGAVTVRCWEWLRERRSEARRVAYSSWVKLLRASQKPVSLVRRGELADKD